MLASRLILGWGVVDDAGFAGFTGFAGFDSMKAPGLLPVFNLTVSAPSHPPGWRSGLKALSHYLLGPFATPTADG